MDVGAPRRVSARAHHLFLFWALCPPVAADVQPRAAIANVSVRVEAVDWQGTKPPPLMWFEHRLGALTQEGRVRFVPGMAAWHTQDFTIRRAMRAHYHNARSVFGVAPRRQTLRQLAGFAHDLRQRRRAALRKGQMIEPRLPTLRGRWFFVLLSWASLSGAVQGLLRGPGGSPAHVH